MSALPAISVVVASYSADRRSLLDGALMSLRAQSHRPHQIIAVVDHNDDLLLRLRHDHPDIEVVPNTESRGLSGARNTGINRATGDVIAFIDDDAIAYPDWAERLAKSYRDPWVMAVGGRIDADWQGPRPYWLPREFDWIVGCSYVGLPAEIADVRNLIGCNMSFRRAVFEQIGGFRSSLGREGANAAGCEETELCIRASRAFPNARLLYDPEIGVRHRQSPDRSRWRYFRSRCLAEGRSKAEVVRMAGKASGLSSERSYVARVLPAAFMHGIVETVTGRDLGGIVRSGAVLAGLVYVLRGYLAGRRAPHVLAQEASPFAPIRIAELDLAESGSSLRSIKDTGSVRYGGAFCLVRSAGRPVQVLEVPFVGTTDSETIRAMAHSDGKAAHVPARVADRAFAPSVRVVVATHDRPASLANCLETLLRLRYGPFEIVVVDNAPSNTDTRDLVGGRFGDSDRIIYRREDKPGLGHAHNCGVLGTATPLVAFTDDDVLVDPQWLAAIAANFETAAVGCVTGLILPAELETRAQYWTERHGGFGKGFERRLFDLEANRPHDVLFPFTAGQLGSGANMAFRTGALARAGGFDPALGAGTVARGGDDLAAFVAILRAGYQLVYEPEAIVWHHHRRNAEGMRSQASGYGVGLGAFLTKQVVEHPRILLDFARRSPWGIAHLFGRSSAKNARLPADYPADLKWQERLGVLRGVPAYLRSRRIMRDYLRHAATGES